ncbi:6891_t:CDS:2 [Funneliformis geosporum]|uniref:4569_t:CDS:1 n=1 Tax=Funneliformis geosporum TaxID=1117311 RepID=A0A9W4SN03_9GLOM|nr:4569_t:CDS:2 [Funneliformis geosporum]CAI2176970.1 6891_t:CDS:2 [Funneliformis geosporum]
MYVNSIIIKLLIIIKVIISVAVAQPTIIRCCHGSVLAEGRIYIGGGYTGDENENINTNDFFSFDLSVPFSTTDMQYEVHANVPIMSTAHALVYAKSEKGGMIYLFGGKRVIPIGDPIYGYSLEKQAWSSITPKVNNGITMPIESSTRIVGITDSSLDTIYIFDNGTMYIYDVLNNFWNPGVIAPYKINEYGAVMLNTSEIAYIGGSDGTTNLPMDQILLYNTKLSLWYIKIAKSNDVMPSPRQGHTASIASDGRIFIYGGFDGNEDALFSSGSTPTFAVLEYDGNEFMWDSPELFNPSSVMRIYHTSHVVGDYLIIAFASVFGTIGFFVIIAGAFYLKKHYNRRDAIPTA